MITNRDIDECLMRAEFSVNDMVADVLKKFYREDVELEAEMVMASLPEQTRQRVMEMLSK